MNLKKISFLLITLIIISCNKAIDGITTNPISIPAEELLNVPYGTDAMQKMDVYLPANRSKDSTKIIFLIHGGGWIGGDKNDFADVVYFFKTQLPNYAIVNINYRLASLPAQNIWPTQLNDVNTAVSFIESKSSEYKINSNKIAIGGASAGGHLALLKAYKNNSGNIKTVVDLFGPTDMADLYTFNLAYQNLFTLFMQGTPTTNASNYFNASPLNYVTNTVPPTIIFHGGLDATVPIRQSDSLNARLTNASVIKQYHVYPTEAHGWTGANATDTYIKMLNFIKQNMQ
jgi:acetyl esterase/lipase